MCGTYAPASGSSCCPRMLSYVSVLPSIIHTDVKSLGQGGKDYLFTVCSVLPLIVAFMHTCNSALTVEKQKIFSVRALFAGDRKFVTKVLFCLCPHIFPFSVRQEHEYHLKCAEPLTHLLIFAQWSREKIQEVKNRFLCSQGNAFTIYISPHCFSPFSPVRYSLPHAAQLI